MLRFITLRQRNLFVTRRFLIASVITGLLIFGTVSPIWATVDFSAYLPIGGAPVNPKFKFTKTVFVEYPNGGKIRDLLQGKNLTVSFTDNANNNTSIKDFMQQINSQIAAERKSLAIMTNLGIHYKVLISGDNKHASFDYSITLTPTITGYVLSKGGSDVPAVLDASWIIFKMTDPVTITTKQYGDLGINYPIGVIKSQLPDVYNVIKGTDAENVLKQNIIDTSPLFAQQPLDKWDSLFDPAYTLAETAGYGYQGQKVAVTTFASGISTVGGSFTVKNVDMDFSADSKYHLSTVERPSSGSINVDGHANPYFVQGEPAFSTTPLSVSNISNTTAQGLSTMTIYAMAGFAAVIAGGIFFWSNRKMKHALHKRDEGPTGPVEYEERRHWADRFDDDKKPKTDDDKKRDNDDNPEKDSREDDDKKSAV